MVIIVSWIVAVRLHFILVPAACANSRKHKIHHAATATTAGNGNAGLCRAKISCFIGLLGPAEYNIEISRVAARVTLLDAARGEGDRGEGQIGYPRNSATKRGIIGPNGIRRTHARASERLGMLFTEFSRQD